MSYLFSDLINLVFLTWPISRLLLLNKLMEDGNTLYKKHKLSEASHRYSYAVKRIPDNNLGHHEKVFQQLKIHLLLNLSRCKRKMKEYHEAVKLAGQVITLHPLCYEAYHARAKAHHSAGHLEEALADLTEAVKVAPQNRELHKILLTLKEEIHNKPSPLPDSLLGDSKEGEEKESTSGIGSGSSREGSNKEFDTDHVIMV